MPNQVHSIPFDVPILTEHLNTTEPLALVLRAHLYVEAVLTTITCPGCGETFVACLQQMADHNTKVVCPKCGKGMDRADGATHAKAAEC